MDYHQRIQQSLDFVENHLTQPVGLAEIAGRAYCSLTHFYRVFRALTGCTVKEYVRRRRLSEAACEVVTGRFYDYVYGLWLPESGYAAADDSEFAIYSSSPDGERTIEHYVPVRQTFEQETTMSHPAAKILLPTLIGLLFTLTVSGWAEELRFDTPAAWRDWEMPRELVQIDAEGALRLTRFRREIDPVRDATLFTHATLNRGQVAGGIWRAASLPQTADRIIDGDPTTFWQPDPADPLAKWEIEVDLGRAVLVRQIQLTFPDREGARPLRQFTVYVSTGARVSVTEDIFKFESVYQTTLPNRQARIVIPLAGRKDSTRALDPGMEIDPELDGHYRMIQFIRIGADEQTPDAGLAEVEVVALGDNIGLGTLERGGQFTAGLVTRDPQYILDGDMNTHASKYTTRKFRGDWRQEGLWWELDLGALFWIDSLFWYINELSEGLGGSSGAGRNTGFAFLYSDGQRTTSGDIDYTPLIAHGDEKIPVVTQSYRFRYLFKPRKIRYLLWHGFLFYDQQWSVRAPELVLTAPGYLAQVILRSDFIDLGQQVGDGRSKAIRGLDWQATLPADTRLRLRSRSGNSLKEKYTFYDKKGEVITESRWISLPGVIQGPVDTAVVVGQDWGAWSNFYQLPDEPFRSETPRRFVQLEAILSTENPQVTPTLHALSLVFEDALIQEGKGRINPQQASPNAATLFTYTLLTRSAAGDTGFDRLRLTVPDGALGLSDVSLHTRAGDLLPDSLMQRGDTLFVELPTVVYQDSLALCFSARLLHNASVIKLDLGRRDRPGLWQSVEPAEHRANIVLLPELAVSHRLIGDLEIDPPLFTPNGDGVNDRVEIRFVVYKTETAIPCVRIRDLAGQLVVELPAEATTGVRRYIWDGRDRRGRQVRPGLYLCHVELDAQVGETSILRPIPVAY